VRTSVDQRRSESMRGTERSTSQRSTSQPITARHGALNFSAHHSARTCRTSAIVAKMLGWSAISGAQ
jgi:hypothetical protein